MARLLNLVFLAFIQYCVAKPVTYDGYPEENKKVNNPKLFEGDMLISNYQKQLALSGGDVDMQANGRKRGATAWDIWPNAIIPYTIDSQLSADQKSRIQNAMAEWESKTCIQFVPRTNELYFVKIVHGYECSSIVGYMEIPGGNTLTLGTGCYNKSTILHELGHAMGFWHEQSRPDRDNYVTINTANIELGKAIYFEKYSNMMIDSLGVPYDYKSIMHYGPKAFSKDANLNTIVSKDQSVRLQKNHDLSDLDIDQANKLYQCKDPNIVT